MGCAPIPPLPPSIAVPLIAAAVAVIVMLSLPIGAMVWDLILR
jgi:hypothetical protein